MTCPHCKSPMAPHASMCSKCRTARYSYNPTPDEIQQLAHAIRWGKVEVLSDRGKPRRVQRGPQGGILCVSDDEERAWRKSNQQPEEESEVDE